MNPPFPNRTWKHVKGHLVLPLIAAATFAGCASTITPTGSMESSLTTMRAAEEVGAPHVPRAKLHLQLAQEQTTYAKELLAQNEKERAGFVLMRAEADAQLALALARETAARAEANAASDKLKNN